MGLDMYLYTNSKKLSEEVNSDEVDLERSFNTPRGIAIYWRKANAVHKWFVDHVQDGNDDCRPYDVTVERLAELHDTCVKVLDSTELVEHGTTDVYDLETNKMVQKPLQVLADDSVARELLPTQSGFFFGDTAYDMWYWWDVERTAEKLGKILDSLKPATDNGWRVVHKDEPDWYVTFTYDSSW